MPHNRPEQYRPPFLAAAATTVVVAALYIVTLSPTTAFWDASEYIATSHILGIPHPPGNPLFVLLAHVWDILLSPLHLSVAVRINLFSATMSALAHGCWFLVVHRTLTFVTDRRALQLGGAAAATLISATAFTVWNQSNVNEKVYTLALFTIALVSWLAFRWRDLGVGRSGNLLLLIVFMLALSIGNHLMALLAVPALLIFVLVVAPQTFKNLRLYGLAAMAVLLGLSVQLFLPIRAKQKPVINEADPNCASFGSAAIAVFTNGHKGCQALAESLTRKQYGKPSVLTDPVEAANGHYGVRRGLSLLSAQLGNYFQYFDWQWARSLAGTRNFFGGLRPIVTLLFATLGVLGAMQHARYDRKGFWYFAVLVATFSVGLTFYLNFRYGFTYPVDVGMNSREVRERDYFFIVSFSLWGLWGGIGLAACSEWIYDRMRALESSVRQVAAVPAAAVLALALLPLALNWSWATRKHDWTARDWAYNLLNSVEPYGVLFTNGDNDTFPLWYAQEVEGVRQDVTVVVMSYLNTPWYAKQVRDLTTPCRAGQSPYTDSTRIICQRPYNASEGPALFTRLFSSSPETQALAAPGERAPSKTILALSDQNIAQIADTAPFRLEHDRVFKASRIETVIPASQVMLPADVFMAFIITDTLEDRPVYFATTTDAYNNLNLGQHVVRVGVAYKLVNGRVHHDPALGIFQMPEDVALSAGPFVNLPWTAELVHNVFVHHDGFPNDFKVWVDAATQQVPMYYAYTHQALAVAYAEAGDSIAATREAQQIGRFVRLGSQRARLSAEASP